MAGVKNLDSIIGEEIFFSYDDFLRSSKLTELDVQGLLKNDAIYFCIRISSDKCAYIFSEDSVPALGDGRLRNGTWGNKVFLPMERVPRSYPELTYLVVDRYDAAKAIGGATVEVSRFKYACEPNGFCASLKDARYKRSPAIIPIKSDGGEIGVRPELFYGVNSRGVSHGFSSKDGYTPHPERIVFRREDLFIRGLVYRDFYDSEIYRKMVSAALMKNAYRQLRRDGLNDEIINAELVLRKRGHRGRIFPRDIIGVLGEFSGKKGSHIFNINGYGINWIDCNGEEKLVSFSGFRSRLRRIRNAAPVADVPEFFKKS